MRRIYLLAGGLLAAVGVVQTAQAFDWTDKDCSHWSGPQFVECLRAKAEMADTDCSQWIKGEKEWRKCQAIRGESEWLKREQQRPIIVAPDR
jgi:hypothetical protein